MFEGGVFWFLFGLVLLLGGMAFGYEVLGDGAELFTCGPYVGCLMQAISIFFIVPCFAAISFWRGAKIAAQDSRIYKTNKVAFTTMVSSVVIGALLGSTLFLFVLLR